MLRFDLPQVWSNVIRWEAFLTFVICCVSLLVGFAWLLPLLTVQGFVRGFIGHQHCPLHRVWRKLFEARQWGGKKEDAGAKMFANKLLFLASGISFTLFMLGSPLWIVPCIALVIFSFMEWAFSYCAACSAYGVWYRKFPPKMG
ncbi:DUF4395 domain-containing protein [Hydrogenophaga sp.]|uniref:DUF4395 domain-containing protein n=1 Tax=Hydrogenophaga sp. TaxID=1904254 RepID=UPI0019B16F10|nr:DUF4395 domain-containing protein [Hydrogenophaga sp.]MBD3893160.1 DUF4395 domain-containing protein [Hydrogenophaga sp.]